MTKNNIGLTGNQIKLIGILMMTLNHLSILFFGVMDKFPILERISSIAGPAVSFTFIYLSAEGYFYTRNKKRYLCNLMVGFWIVELAKFLLTAFLPLSQGMKEMMFFNIFGGIFQAVFCMYLFDHLKSAALEKKWLKVFGFSAAIIMILTSAFLFIILVDISLTFSLILNSILPIVVEGAPLLPLFGLLLHITRDKKWLQGLIAGLIILPDALPDLINNGISGDYWPSLLFFIFFFLYNGKRGKGPNKYFFYAYYPAHIVLFIILNTFVISKMF
ncbi:TraX family protein [Vagococcus elongatus]|uniref:Conjugal transfer protein TraX n=1 Tax=Vagococcus elongatus TaxID=180344 RepID=A0A430ASL2_9ENTE|nr:TraX family protein [Vagococcus elongatus]RSU11048.1 hypothetical protein CBF29_08790 [Vagococcus elongatus]